MGWGPPRPVSTDPDPPPIITIFRVCFAMLSLGASPSVRPSAQKNLNRKLDAIKSCNTASSTKQNLVKSDEQATDTARKAHAACREEEKNKNSASSGRCKELDDFLNGINSPASLPGGREREEMVKYVETVSSYALPE